MRILITGRGTSGSWKIRAEQLGAPIGATVRSDAPAECISAHDVSVLVKRPTAELVARLRASGRPWIWDVVDSWPQPVGNEWGERQARDWMWSMVTRCQPSGIVAATPKMRADLLSMDYHGRSICLPHHARPGLSPRIIRERVTTVVYEGGRQYLGRWSDEIHKQCRRRAWTFLINPPSLADGDIVLAVREQSGYPARHWKSAVKLVNAQACGLPAICVPENGYLSQASGAELWAEAHSDLGGLFDQLEPFLERERIGKIMAARATTLSEVARAYRPWLEQFA